MAHGLLVVRAETWAIVIAISRAQQHLLGVNG